MIHSAGKFAFFHTNGNKESIYGDFIEVGIDARSSQLFVMDIKELAKKCKGKITFWGEIDRQYTIPFGTPEDVRKAVMRVRKSLDNGNGGAIALCEWGKHNPIENIEAVFKSWNEKI